MPDYIDTVADELDDILQIEFDYLNQCHKFFLEYPVEHSEVETFSDEIESPEQIIQKLDFYFCKHLSRKLKNVFIEPVCTFEFDWINKKVLIIYKYLHISSSV